MSVETHRATVYAGPTATDYVRAGTGSTVLILTRQHAEHPLFLALASMFRVIAPELPRHFAECDRDACAVQPFEAWLRDFLDGLGIWRVNLVADEAFALDALRFCASDPTRVDRIALLISSIATGGYRVRSER